MKTLIKSKQELENEYRSLCRQFDNINQSYINKRKNKFSLKHDLKELEIKIELSKLSSRIKIIQNTIDIINAKIKLYNEPSISSKVTEKKKNISSVNTINIAIENMKKIIEDEYKKLDILLEQYHLEKEFNIERKEGIGKYQLDEYLTIGSLIGLLLGIPINVFFSGIIPLSIPTITILSGLLGATITSIIKIIHTQKRIELFNTLNNKLGENKISQKENKSIFKKILKKETDITTMITILKEQERSYEEAKENERKKHLLNINHEKNIEQHEKTDDQYEEGIKLNLRK